MTSSTQAEFVGGGREHWLEDWVRWCNTLTQPIAFIGVLGMLVASGVTVADVVLRYAFSSGIVALNEITAMAFTVAVTACIPCGMAQGVSLAVDVLEPRMAPRTAALLKAAGGTLLFVFLTVLAWRMAVFANGLRTDGRTTQMLSMSLLPFMAAAAVLLGISALVQLVVSLNAWRKTFAVMSASLYKPRGATVLDAAILVVLAITIVIAIMSIADFTTVQKWAQAHPTTTVFAALVLMWAYLMFLIPLAAVLGLMGLFGCALIIGFAPSYSAMVTEMLGFLSNYQIAVLPLFLMMGSFAAASGIADDAYALAHSGLGDSAAALRWRPSAVVRRWVRSPDRRSRPPPQSAAWHCRKCGRAAIPTRCRPARLPPAAHWAISCRRDRVRWCYSR